MTRPGDPLPTVMVVPTGIGCEVGGYAGDAVPAARLLAAASGCLITHPNVMNGASLYWSDPAFTTSRDRASIVSRLQNWHSSRFARSALACCWIPASRRSCGCGTCRWPTVAGPASG